MCKRFQHAPATAIPAQPGLTMTAVPAGDCWRWHPQPALDGDAAGPAAIPHMRAEMACWRPAAIVAVTREGSLLSVFLTRLLGHQAFGSARS